MANSVAFSLDDLDLVHVPGCVCSVVYNMMTYSVLHICIRVLVKNLKLQLSHKPKGLALKR